MEIDYTIERRKPFECECGDPPFKLNSCREPVCERCSRLEQRRDMYGRKNDTTAETELSPVKGNKHWDKNWVDNTPILYPDAIARLDRMLLTATQGQV